MTNENTEFDLEWAKRGGVILAGYSQENTGEGGSIHKTFLIKMLVLNVFVDVEKDFGEGFPSRETFEAFEIDGFCIIRMATREECMAAGVEYIERPVSATELTELREDREMLECMIKTPAGWI